jgi:hypothetical protein
MKDMNMGRNFQREIDTRFWLEEVKEGLQMRVGWYSNLTLSAGFLSADSITHGLKKLNKKK